MRQYEVMYIISAKLEDEAIKELIEKFKALVLANAGTVTNVEEWGRRRLAYTIDYENEGYYVLMKVEAEGEFPRELERNFEITDGILRYLVTRID